MFEVIVFTRPDSRVGVIWPARETMRVATGPGYCGAPKLWWPDAGWLARDAAMWARRGVPADLSWQWAWRAAGVLAQYFRGRQVPELELEFFGWRGEPWRGEKAFADRQVANAARGKPPIAEKIVRRWCAALAWGGVPHREYLELLGDKDIPPDSRATAEIVDAASLPPRTHRSAWRRSMQGGPIWISQEEDSMIRPPPAAPPTPSSGVRERSPPC